MPSGLRTAILASCCLSSITNVYASVLSPAEYLDLVEGPDPSDYWTLNSENVTGSDWALDQSEQNGKSELGSLDAPSYDKFIPNQKRQTSSPWGSRTALNTNPQDAPNTGVVRYYNFTIARSTLSPDGVPRSLILVNGQFPGPTIEANWGDTISVTVQNNLVDEGTAMHWHGMPQTNTNWNDGVPGVTQCPIAPGQSYTYSFKASLYGTTWYHAHYSAQYTAGLYGAMIIHGPTDNAPYDTDLGPVLLTDYYYADYHSTVADVMGTVPSKISPASDNNLINGKGFADCSAVTGPCTPNAGLAQFQFASGKTHRLRVINAGVEAIQKFSIDGHTLKVMAIDFTPIVPYETTVLTLAIGQRVDVIVKAIGKPSNSYWMRSTISSCSKGKQRNALALIFYEAADKSVSPPSVAQPDKTDPCAEAPIDKSVPYYSLTPSSPGKTIEIDVTVGRNASGNFLWAMNNSTFRANYSNPTLPLVQSGTDPSTFPAEWNILDFSSAKSVRLVINNRSPVTHPMHLHGYDMYVLAAGGGPRAGPPASWNGDIVNAVNPMRRDTFLLQPSGYMVVQIETTNPGVWPFHCHIAWHVSGGLYMNFLTQTPDIRSKIKSPDAANALCRSWNAWTTGAKVDQIDSGL